MLSTSVKSVIDIQRKRSEREKGTQTKILTTAKDKINNYALHGHLRCLYQVPQFLIGSSPYNNDDMMLYIASTLSKEGFYIEVGHSNFILISWDIKDIRKAQVNKKKSREKLDSLIGIMNLKK